MARTHACPCLLRFCGPRVHWWRGGLEKSHKMQKFLYSYRGVDIDKKKAKKPNIHFVNAKFEGYGAKHIRFCKWFKGNRGNLAHGWACCSHCTTHGQLSLCHATYIPRLHLFFLSIVLDL